MKKIMAIALTFIILITGVSVYASYEDINWGGAPSSEILIMEENSPIIIENEDLLFDFTKEYASYIRYYMSGLTRAEYTMSNPSENSQTVEIAFPFLSEVLAFNSEIISIEIDGEEVDFQIFLGETLLDAGRELEDDEYLDFVPYIQSVTTREYSPRNYDLDEIGKLYRFEVSPGASDGLTIAIDDFIYDIDKSIVMNKGFNTFRYNEGIETMSVRIDGREELELLVFGEDIDFNFKAYLDENYSEESDNYSLNSSTEEISLRDYLLREVKIYEEGLDYLDKLADNQIFNIVLEKLDDNIDKNVRNRGIDQLFSLDYSERFFILVYDVEFEPYSTVELGIRYNSRGDRDIFNSYDPLYYFEHVLNPARKWSSVKNLNIEIRPPAEYPYVIDSNLELVRDEEGNYLGSFDSLPEEDFTFSLYSKERFTTLDRISGFFRRTPYAGGILGGIIGFTITKIYGRVKKNKGNSKEKNKAKNKAKNRGKNKRK